MVVDIFFRVFVTSSQGHHCENLEDKNIRKSPDVPHLIIRWPCWWTLLGPLDKRRRAGSRWLTNRKYFQPALQQKAPLNHFINTLHFQEEKRECIIIEDLP